MKATSFSTGFVLAASLAMAPQNIGAHSTNPNHLDSFIRNPFSSTGKITSAAPTHHKLRLHTGDVSLDIAYNSGSTAGKSVYFKIGARSSGDSLRGKVIAGGRDSPVYSCYADDPKKPVLEKGGNLVKVQVEIKKSGTTNWVPVGWVIYAHLNLTTSSWYNNTYINSGDFIGTVADGLKSNTSCWTGPHVHVEVFNNLHYAGYVSLPAGTTVSSSGNLLCVGGSRTSVKTC